jgi:hypothetical protein
MSRKTETRVKKKGGKRRAIKNKTEKREKAIKIWNTKRQQRANKKTDLVTSATLTPACEELFSGPWAHPWKLKQWKIALFSWWTLFLLIILA